MPEIIVEQALFAGRGPGGYRPLARSPGFAADWLAEAERLCAGFGARPDGVACPGCVFAQPFGRHHVAVVQAADQAADDAGGPGGLGFHLVVLPRGDYEGLGGDPFQVADRCPPPWPARGELPTLTWPAEAFPPRRLDQVRRVVQRPESAQLLGGCQVLVDGGRVWFERPAPDTELLRGLWTLLPTRTRAELWPASFAFGNALAFHALVLPPAAARAAADALARYNDEDAAADYPDGRYELGLHIAVDDGDQAELDRLFARRSRSDMWRLGLLILGLMIVLPLVVRWVAPPPEAEPEKPKPEPPAKLRPELPAADAPVADPGRWRKRLEELAGQAGVTPADLWLVQPGPVEAFDGTGGLPWLGLLTILRSDELLLAAIDRRLGTPDAQRDPGLLAPYGLPKRQLRVLLWKHQVEEYNDTKLGDDALLDRLEGVIHKKLAPKDGP